MKIPKNFLPFAWMAISMILVFAHPLWGQSIPRDNQGSASDNSSPVTANGDTLSQWMDRLNLSGFTNAGYVKTGQNEAEPNGHFYAGERLFGAGLFLDAQVADSISVYNELFFYNQAVTMKGPLTCNSKTPSKRRTS